MHGGLPLVYLDSANTSQKPRQVLDAMIDHYERHNANVAPGRCTCSAEEATAAYEGGRDKVAAFIDAPSAGRGRLHQERLRGAQPGREHAGLARPALQVGPGDEIVITEMEHHSNIVPWQLLAQRTGATLRWFGDHRRRPARLSRHRRADHRAHQGRLAGCTCPTCSAPSTRSPRSPPRRTRSARWWSSTAPRPCRRCPVDVPALGADFYAFTGHKVVRPDRHRRALGPPRAAGRAAAVPRRRRDDRDGDDDRLDVRRRRRTGSRPARRRSRRRSGSARPWTT